MIESFETAGGRVTLSGEGPPLLLVPGAGLNTSNFAGFFAPWAEAFTIVHWDQPATPPLTYNGLAAAGAAVAEAMAGRLGHKPALLATSGGTVVGLKIARARPETIAAYVGAGQVVNRAEQEALSYVMVLARARAAGDAEAVAALERIGPPPYADPTKDAVKGAYANAPTALEAPEWAAFAAAGTAHEDRRAAAFAAYLALRDELAAFNARAMATRFEIPMVFLQGADDAHTVTSEVVAYAGEVRAPLVVLELMAGAGHLNFFLRGPMLDRLNRYVRPLVEGS
jgi:pimeloyl-ACP methyl ester carboxylesterase